jgi:hypothetical protein
LSKTYTYHHCQQRIINKREKCVLYSNVSHASILDIKVMQWSGYGCKVFHIFPVVIQNAWKETEIPSFAYLRCFLVQSLGCI